MIIEHTQSGGDSGSFTAYKVGEKFVYEVLRIPYNAVGVNMMSKEQATKFVADTYPHAEFGTLPNGLTIIPEDEALNHALRYLDIDIISKWDDVDDQRVVDYYYSE